MKGLQHDVIEIRETDSEEIEKILVFLKPGEHKINVSATRAEAADILQRVKIKKNKARFSSENPGGKHPDNHAGMWFCCIGGLPAAAFVKIIKNI